MPEELINNEEIDDKLMQLQKRFDANFIDTSTIFEAKGFDNADEKISLLMILTMFLKN